MIAAHEMAAAQDSLRANGEWERIDEADQHKAGIAQAYYNQLNHSVDARKTLEECQPMAKALFGETLESALELLNRQFHTVRVYVDAQYRGGGDAKFQEEINHAIWQGWPSEDENKIDKTIRGKMKIIEDTCLPVLRAEPKA